MNGPAASVATTRWICCFRLGRKRVIAMATLLNRPRQYEVRLIGGPFDGLVAAIDASSIDDRPVLTLPAKPLDEHAEIHGLVEMGARRSAYALIERNELDDGRASVTYGFRAFDPPHRAERPGRWRNSMAV